MSKDNQAPFEQRMARLEEISRRLKESDLPLDQSVTLFEEGITLSRSLEAELSEIEGRVEILINQPSPEGGDSPETREFTEAQES